MLKAFFLGLLASAFFALTFILNRQISVAGGHWLWTAALRYFWMLPMLALLLRGGRIRVVSAHIRSRPLPWLVWSTTGFGVFYLFISMAAATSPAWLTAATWQVTIIAGALMGPLLAQPRDKANPAKGRNTFPKGQILIGLLMGAGVLILQTGEAFRGAASASLEGQSWAAALFVLVAAFAYPLGNRKMMALASRDLGTLERVFGMTLCSMPFWILLCGTGLALGIRPVASQVFQTFLVALFSGVIATILFFRATEMVKDHPGQLAAVESTQAGEVIFSLLGGVVLYGDHGPDPGAYAGIALILGGLLLNPLTTHNRRQSVNH